MQSDLRLFKRDSATSDRLAGLLMLAAVTTACGSSIDASLENKTCTDDGSCLPGYVCSPEHICVKGPRSLASGQSAPDASTPVEAGSDASGVNTGTAPPPACSRGVDCEGSCVDVQQSIQHCGGCGQKCPAIDHGEPTCKDGTCGVACNDGYTRCGDRCYQLSSDPHHCGSCAFSCPAASANGTVSCVSGECHSTCNPGYQDCGGACVRLESDVAHCGACGNTCQADQICAAGACVKECPPGTVECDRGCVDSKIDPRHCGACGRVCTGPEGSTAVCRDGTCAFDCGPGLTACGTACVDTQIDGMNCGTCGRVCPDGAGFSHPVCEAGTCNTRCDLGFVACEGQCVSIALLANSRAFAACAVLAGLEDFMMCAGMGENASFCDNQCVNTASDERHCGGCWRACAAGQTCDAAGCM